MFFDLKNCKVRFRAKEFQCSRKEILKMIKIKKKSKNPYYFSFLKQDTKSLKKISFNIYKEFTSFEKIVLIGTGGSSLGSKAILNAAFNDKVIFLENIDPALVLKTLKNIKTKKLLLLIISKSGETSEVLSLYQVITNYFSSLFTIKNNTIIITEKKNSYLYNISKSNNIRFIDHNPNIGGRFSCFSETGLIPLKLAGLNINHIINVSEKTFDDCLNKNKYNFFDNITIFKHLINKKKYKGHVVISYQDSLRSLLQWYRQLWGESLGKKGKGIHFMPATGSIDQHSQLQMWLDGPNNLIYTIILPKKRKIDYSLNDKMKAIPSYLNKKTLGNILNAMGDATYKELVKSGRPVRIIYLEDDSLYPAIKLMSFLMLEVATLGLSLGINPFDQPAVERVKILTKKNLNKYAKN